MVAHSITPSQGCVAVLSQPQSVHMTVSMARLLSKNVCTNADAARASHVNTVNVCTYAGICECFKLVLADIYASLRQIYMSVPRCHYNVEACPTAW